MGLGCCVRNTGECTGLRHFCTGQHLLNRKGRFAAPRRMSLTAYEALRSMQCGVMGCSVDVGVRATRNTTAASVWPSAERSTRPIVPAVPFLPAACPWRPHPSCPASVACALACALAMALGHISLIDSNACRHHPGVLRCLPQCACLPNQTKPILRMCKCLPILFKPHASARCYCVLS